MIYKVSIVFNRKPTKTRHFHLEVIVTKKVQENVKKKRLLFLPRAIKTQPPPDIYSIICTYRSIQTHSPSSDSETNKYKPDSHSIKSQTNKMINSMKGN